MDFTLTPEQEAFREEVRAWLKVNIPRNDLSVTVANVKTPTPFGFGGWVAMTKGTGGTDVMMGDLVLTQDEVNPVMSALLDNGLEVTALHNHFFWDEPRMFYMHVHGHGKPADLARQVKPALDLIGKGATPPSASAAPRGPSPPACRGRANDSAPGSRSAASPFPPIPPTIRNSPRSHVS